MTRNNLAAHISWLLSHEVTPPVGVHAIPSTHSTAAAQTVYEEFGEDIEQQEVSRAPPAPIRRAAQAVNVGTNFTRPAAPARVPKPMREIAEVLANDTMGRLSSASGSRKPALISQQHQLATPASTTASSSLTQGYAAMLRGKRPNFSLYHFGVTNLSLQELLINLDLTELPPRVSQELSKPHKHRPQDILRIQHLI